MIAQTASGLDDENPWPGLREFGEDDKKYFNGRVSETENLLRLVNDAPLTILFGASGLGKTSLLLAGLAPRLRAQNKLPVYLRLDLRDGQQLIKQVFSIFEVELDKEGVERPKPKEDESLWEYLHRADLELWSKQNNLLTPVFIFDQFEEMFTIGAANPDVAKFRDDLADLVENLVPDRVVEQYEQAPTDALDLRARRSKMLLSFREDYLADTENWRRAIPSLSTPNRMRLITMNGDQAFQAVKQTGGRLVDSETALAIVKFVAAAPGKLRGRHRAAEAAPNGETGDLPQLMIEPALLSLICTKLNKQRKEQKNAVIDQGQLGRPAQDILKDFYNDCVGKFPRARRFIEEELITEGGYRNAFPRDDALARGDLSAEQLEELVNRRLLRKVPHSDTDRIELIHDRLTDVVQESRDARRQDEETARKRKKRWRFVVLGALATIGFALAVYFIRDMELRSAVKERKEAVDSAHIWDYDLALSKLSHALSEIEWWGGDQSTIVEVLVDRGKIYALRKKFPEAEQDLNQAVEEAKVEPTFASDEALALESLASVHEHVGAMEKAIKEYENAINRYQAARDFSSVARILEMNANREEKEKQFELSNADYTQALTNYGFSEDTIGVTRTIEAIKRTRVWGYLIDLKRGEVSQTRGSRFTIGRDVPEEDLKNDLSFSGRVISRHHLEVAQKGFRIEDYRSLNGSTIDAEWLPYGRRQSLQNGDIITLANTEVLQFTKTKPEPPNVPSNIWAIFIDGTTKRASYLNEATYSLVVTPSGLTVETGDHPSAVLKLRRPDNNKPPEVISADDRWAVCVQGKVGDFQYPKTYLNPGQMNYLFDYPARLVEKKKSAGSERAVKKSPGQKPIICEGPPFQIVPLFTKDEPR